VRPVNDRTRPARARALAAWFWTGPLGHLLGGGLDLIGALVRYWVARIRGRVLR
jgi:hypothetical protein